MGCPWVLGLSGPRLHRPPPHQTPAQQPHSRCRRARSSLQGSRIRPGPGGRPLHSCSQHRSGCSLGRRSHPGRLGADGRRASDPPSSRAQASALVLRPKKGAPGTSSTHERPQWVRWVVGARCQGLEGPQLGSLAPGPVQAQAQTHCANCARGWTLSLGQMRPLQGSFLKPQT